MKNVVQVRYDEIFLVLLPDKGSMGVSLPDSTLEIMLPLIIGYHVYMQLAHQLAGYSEPIKTNLCSGTFSKADGEA